MIQSKPTYNQHIKYHSKYHDNNKINRIQIPAITDFSYYTSPNKSFSIELFPIRHTSAITLPPNLNTPEPYSLPTTSTPSILSVIFPPRDKIYDFWLLAIYIHSYVNQSPYRISINNTAMKINSSSALALTLTLAITFLLCPHPASGQRFMTSRTPAPTQNSTNSTSPLPSLPAPPQPTSVPPRRSTAPALSTV